MERPNRCFIRQEWFEAVSFLPAEERCAFYEALLAFVYYGTQKDTLPPSVRGMLEMAKPTLTKDIQSYTQKVVTNRQNGSLGGRPRLDITQTNPTQPTKTEKPLHKLIQKQIQDTFSCGEVNDGDRERLILIELFACGCFSPLEEAAKMVDYYKARGWVAGDGNAIIDVSALARVWKCENKSKYFANVRKKWALFLKGLGRDFSDILVRDFVRMERKKEDTGDTCIIYCLSEEFIRELEEKHLQPLRVAAKAWGVSGISYRIVSPLAARDELTQPFTAV